MQTGFCLFWTKRDAITLFRSRLGARLILSNLAGRRRDAKRERSGNRQRYNNGNAAFYATLIGAYLAPGTVSEAMFMIDGILWDVRAKRLYVAQTAEGHSKAVGPAVAVEDRHALAQAK